MKQGREWEETEKVEGGESVGWVERLRVGKVTSAEKEGMGDGVQRGMMWQRMTGWHRCYQWL